jgi:DNA-binding CsgD family transcriptional regulator
METAARIARGMTYKETAHELGISIRTVKAHMGRVYEKTGAASNAALALLMRGEGTPNTKVR